MTKRETGTVKAPRWITAARSVGVWLLFGAALQAATMSISLGQTINGVLEASDDRTRLGDGSFADNYELTLTTAQTVTIEMNSSTFDTFLFVVDSADNLLGVDNNGGSGSNSRLVLTLRAGTFIIEATSSGPSAGGPYTLSVSAHQITGVLDAAGFKALISPGAIVSVFGDFAEETNRADAIPLPFDLGGFSVTFDGKPGALFGVFAGDDFDQANVQVPWDVDVSDDQVEVKVHWKDDASEVWSEPFEVAGAQASPGIYMFPPGTSQAIVTNFHIPGDDVIEGSWAQAAGSVDAIVGQPAAIGGVIVIWANGLGPVMPEPLTGALPPGDFPVPTKTVRVTIGGRPAQVLAALLHPASVGLSQINVIVPEGVVPGDNVPIIIEVVCDDGTVIRSRADVTIAIRPAP